MVKIKNIIFLLCVTLSMTGAYLFKVGLAKFTLFHPMALITFFVLFFISLRSKKVMITMPRYFILAMAFLLIMNLLYIKHIKFTSFVYSVIILLELLLMINIAAKLKTEEIMRIVKAIILIYFIDILVASVLIFFNFSPPGFLGSIFQIYDFDGRIRPYGFSDEPSYAAIVLVFTLFVLFKGNNFSYNKSEFKWYVMASLAILLTRSSYGYMLLGILLIYFTIKSRVMLIHINNIVADGIISLKSILLSILVAATLTVAVFNYMDLTNLTSLHRLIKISKSLTQTADDPAKALETIAYVDGSASMRMLPTLYLAENFSNSPLRYVLFGRGAGHATPFFSDIYGGNVTLLGFVPSFIFNYGLLGSFIFFLLFVALFPKKKTVLMILFLLFVFNADFNTQIFLYVLFCIALSRQIDLNHVADNNLTTYAQN